MTIDKMCDTWLDMIRNNKHHEESIITKIFIKHGMNKNINACISLSNYYDHLTGIEENNEDFLLDISNKYGKIDYDDWSAVEGVVNEV